jgi:hypothetical protein
MSAINFNSVSSEYYNSWKFPEVGGKPGIIGTIGHGVKENGYPIPGFVAAYSPDGIGIHGTTIEIIGSSAGQKNFEKDKVKFEAFAKDIRILKQDDKYFHKAAKINFQNALGSRTCLLSSPRMLR